MPRRNARGNEEYHARQCPNGDEEISARRNAKGGEEIGSEVPPSAARKHHPDCNDRTLQNAEGGKNIGETVSPAARQRKKALHVLSVLYKFAYCALKIILSITTGSLFFAASAVSSLSFGTAKAVAIRGKKDGSDAKSECLSYALVALLIIAGSLAYGLYMIRLLFRPETFRYGEILGIAIATVYFAEFGISLKNLFQNRETPFSALKLLSFSSVLLGIAYTQVVITSFASASDMSAANALGGIVFSAAAALIGLYMLIKVWIFLRKQKRAAPPPPTKKAKHRTPTA